jgi:predicted nucleotidyltransferase
VEKTREELRRAVAELAGRRPEIQSVFLFGSLARGDAAPGSDADLLVILSHSDLPFPERIPVYLPDGCRIGVDVFPYTQEEFDDMRRRNDAFLRRALREAVQLWPPETPG